MYKLISLDLDGTLFNSKGKISKRNMDVINKCHSKGIITVIATGRPPRHTFNYLPEVLASEYIICYNGGRIYRNYKLIKEVCFESNIAKSIYNFFITKANNPCISVEIDDHIYSNFDLSTVFPGIDFGILDYNKLDFSKVCKILVMNGDDIPYDEFYEKFSSKSNIIKTYNNKLIEIMDISVSKYNAIKYVASELCISTNEVVAFGDDSNDIEILKNVGLGVAMKNANIHVKEAASSETDSNDNDGVATFLEVLINDKK